MATFHFLLPVLMIVPSEYAKKLQGMAPNVLRCLENPKATQIVRELREKIIERLRHSSACLEGIDSARDGTFVFDRAVRPRIDNATAEQIDISGFNGQFRAVTLADSAGPLIIGDFQETTADWIFTPYRSFTSIDPRKVTQDDKVAFILSPVERIAIEVLALHDMAIKLVRPFLPQHAHEYVSDVQFKNRWELEEADMNVSQLLDKMYQLEIEQ